MAVTTLYMSSLDKEKRTFTDKKLCDELDKKLELAEELRVFLESNVADINEELAETIGMLLADTKEKLLVALKGKPHVLNEEEKDVPDNVESLDQQKKTG